MDEKWIRRGLAVAIWVLLCASIACGMDQEVKATESVLDKELKDYVDGVFSVEEFRIAPGIEIERVDNGTVIGDDGDGSRNDCRRGRSFQTIPEYVGGKLDQYAQTHVLSVNLRETARFLSSAAGEVSSTPFHH